MKQKYHIDKALMTIAFCLILTLIMWGVLTEGINIIRYRTANVSCEGRTEYCKIEVFGQEQELKKGESIIVNSYPQYKLNIINYGSLIITIGALILNHKLYNKNYKIKE